MHIAYNNNKLIMERLTRSDTQETLTRNNPQKPRYQLPSYDLNSDNRVLLLIPPNLIYVGNYSLCSPFELTKQTFFIGDI